MTTTKRPFIISAVHSSLRLSFVTAAAATLALAGAANTPAAAAVIYDESGAGDLSNNGLTPTPISLGLGSNSVLGSIGHDQAGAIDRDYLTFTIGANQQLTALNLLAGTQTLGFSFIGLQAGNQVTLATNAATAAGLLGWTHYDSGDVGTDILDDMSVAANGSSGFSTPLGPGTYSIWLQEISPGGSVPFGLEFLVAQVPEPASWAMMLTGFGFIGLTFRRRRRFAKASPA